MSMTDKVPTSCIRDTVPLAVGKWYDFHEFGWYMGNVGLDELHI